MDEEQYVDCKEAIASIIFDYDAPEYVRPHEEDCHALAEEILDALGFSEPNLPEDNPEENR